MVEVTFRWTEQKRLWLLNASEEPVGDPKRHRRALMEAIEVIELVTEAIGERWGCTKVHVRSTD
jgi:hypothetical protein